MPMDKHIAWNMQAMGGQLKMLRMTSVKQESKGLYLGRMPNADKRLFQEP